LGKIEILAKTGDLGVEGMGGSVKPGNINRDDCVDVGKSSSHFSYFFEDNVMG
jgi:hypothetical protein